MRIDGMTVDDVGVRPSRLQLPALLATIPAAGAAPATPAQTREMMDKSGQDLRGHAHRKRRDARHLGGDAAGPAQARRRCGSIWKTARSANLRSKGFDGRTPKGPVKVGRFALKSLDIANFMRMSALFSNPAQPPPPDQALGMIAADRGRRTQGLRGALQEHRQAGQRRQLQTWTGASSSARSRARRG